MSQKFILQTPIKRLSYGYKKINKIILGKLLNSYILDKQALNF